MDTFRRDGLTFDVRDGGPPEGPAVVLLHGFPQDSTAWTSVEPLLHRKGLRTLAPDQRGYSPGARPPGRSAYRVSETVGDVLALLDAAGLERALADSEAMFRYAFDDAPIGMALTGLDGAFLRVNKAFAALLGTTTEALHELRVQDVTHPEDLATDRANIAELTSGRTLPQEVDKRYRGPDGRDVPVRVHATPVHDAAGQPVFVFAHVLAL